MEDARRHELSEAETLYLQERVAAFGGPVAVLAMVEDAFNRDPNLDILVIADEDTNFAVSIGGDTTEVRSRKLGTFSIPTTAFVALVIGMPPEGE